MLQEDLPKLESYVNSSKEVYLRRWWAQLAEVHRSYDRALKYYEQAGDYRALIKILCQHGDFGKAAEVATATQDPGACYLLARQLEAKNQVCLWCSFRCLISTD